MQKFEVSDAVQLRESADASDHVSHQSRRASSRSRSVQRKSSRVQRQQNSGSTTDAVHAVASEGVSGASSSLPFADAIQQSFGRHDISNVQAHVSPSANAQLGSQAYAMGNHVSFASGSPSLHTAAHEAAHVVQQRAGVHLKGGVGEVGDRYEQHADRVADAVVAGRSAEGILNEMSGGANSDAAIQKQAVQFWGGAGHITLTEQSIGELSDEEKRFLDDGGDGREGIAKLTGIEVLGFRLPRGFFIGGPANAHLTDMNAYCNRPDYSAQRVDQARSDNAVAMELHNHARGVRGPTTMGEGPDHGEGLNYSNPDLAANAAVNYAATRQRINQAVNASNLDQRMLHLGWSFHMAQDRGSHWEGTQGMGHDSTGDRTDTPDGSKINTDDPAQNPVGWQRAQGFSREVARLFVAGMRAKSGNQASGGGSATTAASAPAADSRFMHPSQGYSVIDQPDRIAIGVPSTGQRYHRQSLRPNCQMYNNDGSPGPFWPWDEHATVMRINNEADKVGRPGGYPPGMAADSQWAFVMTASGQIGWVPARILATKNVAGETQGRNLAHVEGTDRYIYNSPND